MRRVAAGRFAPNEYAVAEASGAPAVVASEIPGTQRVQLKLHWTHFLSVARFCRTEWHNFASP